MKSSRGAMVAVAVGVVLAFVTPPAHAVAHTVRVSVATGNPGTQGNDISGNPRVSANGRYVVFSSVATNLVSGDTNKASDIFVRDTVSNTTKRVSVANGNPGTQGTCAAARPVWDPPARRSPPTAASCRS